MNMVVENENKGEIPYVIKGVGTWARPQTVIVNLVMG
jgi:hypothetical protein